MSMTQKEELADYVLTNDGGLEELQVKVEYLLDKDLRPRAYSGLTRYSLACMTVRLLLGMSLAATLLYLYKIAV